MILAPASASNEAWHAIRGVQGAWRLALHTAVPADIVTVAAARRLAADAECELRDLWNEA